MTAATLQHDPPQGAQRLSLDALRTWESLSYGMFIHYGMSTFVGQELPDGTQPSTTYAPTNLDVDQWIQVARDAGMKYAVLTTKHVAGHCLWPSKLTDYHVGTSSVKTDVVDRFVQACEKHQVLPGFYYCSWDNHHKLGSITPSMSNLGKANTTEEYREFQRGQVQELLTHYGDIAEVWIDIPGVLGRDGRHQQYDQIVKLQPKSVIMMNHGFGDGSHLNVDYAWPTDLMAIERWLPSSNRGYKPWHKIAEGKDAAKEYYIPGEVCDPIGYDWFHVENDPPRSDAELLGMRLIARERHVNLLLDVPPDRSGVIPKERVEALMRLAQNVGRFGGVE